MALLDARCGFCGTALKLDGGLETTNCQFCGAEIDVGGAVRNFYGGAQAAASTKNHAKAALICGIISIIGALLTILFAAEGLTVRVVAFGLFSILFAIPGIVLGNAARREPGAQRGGIASSGFTCSVVGLVLAALMTFICAVAY